MIIALLENIEDTENIWNNGFVSPTMIKCVKSYKYSLVRACLLFPSVIFSNGFTIFIFID